MWIWIIIIAIIIGAIWGASSSRDGERGAGAFSGGLRRQRQHQGRHIYRPVQGTVP